MLRLLDEHLSPTARDAAIDALLTDREALTRMKLALAYAPATEQFVKAAQALPVHEPWFRRWQFWFSPVAAAAAIYAVVGGLNRPDTHETRMADAVAPATEQLARIDDRISGGTFEQPSDIFRQNFD
jgi:hypothetical protein